MGGHRRRRISLRRLRVGAAGPAAAPRQLPSPKGQAFSLCIGAARHLWLGTDAGLFCLTLHTGAFRELPTPTAAGAAVFQLFLHPRTGHLWVSYRDGSLAVLDTSHDGRLVSSRRQLPGLSFLFQPDGTAAEVWVSFVAAHHIDPLTRLESLTPPGFVRRGLTGPAQQYVQTPYLLMPGTVPLRLFSTSALYELGDHGRLHEISRWLPGGQEDNFEPFFTHADSVYEWVTQQHYLRLRVRGPHAGQMEAEPLRSNDSPKDHHHSYIVYQDALGAQWCYAYFWRGVYKRRAASLQVVHPRLPAGVQRAPSAWGITRLADGRLFLGTYDGHGAAGFAG